VVPSGMMKLTKFPIIFSAMNVDEMQRLQTLLMKARLVSTNLWIGANKKEWKKYSSKVTRNIPNLGPNAMLM
jgi:hypothetical protein